MDTIVEALASRCRSVEELVRLRVEFEKRSVIDSFDSGKAVEDILRDALTAFLPSRYQVTAGTVVDSRGASAGDVDIVVFNAHWFPEVLAPATPATRRRFLPYEGVYAVGEVKQQLTFKTLDAAMEKLVTCHRLSRMPTPRDRIAENREFPSDRCGLSNPLYSFVLACEAGSDLQKLIERFFDINKSLKRLEVVRALCVLGGGTVTWAVHDEHQPRPALFMESDLAQPIVPSYFPVSNCGPSLFTLLENLYLHLYHSVLGPEDLASRYGPSVRNVKVPKTGTAELAPDLDPYMSLRPSDG